MARIIKPNKLNPGDTIALIAPSWVVPSKQLDKGIEFLKNRGYKVKEYSQIRRRYGYFAGIDKMRADALMKAFSDKNVDAIFCVRGGFGAHRILPHIDFDVIRKNPKPFLGYSDITVLLLSIFARTGLITFHGPMVSSDFGKRTKSYTLDYFSKALEEPSPVGLVAYPKGHKIECLNPGRASGRIVGGNLSLITKLIGTGLLPSFKDKIVFLEDTEEAAYRIDGYLSHLFQATDIEKARGYIIGEFTKTPPPKGGGRGWTLKQVIYDYFSNVKQPTIYGFPCGHGREKITIPIGVNVVIDADEKTLEFTEAGVRL